MTRSSFCRSMVTCATLACLIFASGAMLCHSVSARDIYVDNVNGDDRNDGSLPDSSERGIGPCRTITRALKHAQRGDRIILAKTDVPYRESITLQGGRHSGSEGRPFVLMGNGAILDGSREVPADAWEHVSGTLFRFRPPYLSSQQVFLDGVPADRAWINDKSELEQVQPMQWSLLGGYVYFRTEDTRTPQNYDLRHSYHRVGLTLYGVRHVEILDMTVQGFALDGINAHDSVFASRLSGVTSRGNGRSGISVGGASRLAVDASLVGNNGIAQVRVEGYSKTEITNSDLIDDSPVAPSVKMADGARISVDGQWMSE